MSRPITKRIIILVLSVVLIGLPLTTSAATNNTVDRIPTVRIDQSLTDVNTPVLQIEEARAGEFRGEPQRIRLILNNAEWITSSLVNNITFGDGAEGITNTSFFGDSIFQLTLVPDEEADDPGWWRIPLYSTTTSGGYATVTIEPLSPAVTAETIPYAEILNGRTGEIDVSLNLPGNQPPEVMVGDIIDAGDDVFVELRETAPNMLTTQEQTFIFELNGGNWFPNSRSRLNTAEMERNTEIEGDNQVILTRIRRATSEQIEVVLRSQGFSDEPAVIRIPLYFEVNGAGNIELNVSLRNSHSPDVDLLVATLFQEPEPPAEPDVTEVAFIVGQNGYWIDGRWIAADVAPYIQPTTDGLGRIMVPVRFVSDATGADEVIWDPINRNVTVLKGDILIQMTIGSNQLIVNDDIRSMDAVAEIQDIGGGLGRTMVPLAHLARALDVDYEWIAETQSVTFSVVE